MKVLLSWLRDFVDVPGTAAEIGARMSLRGLALEGIEAQGDADAVLDFDVTANRPDCLSIRGIAREIATVYALPLRAAAAVPAPGAGGRGPKAGTAAPGPAEPVTVAIEQPDLCARYVAAVADVAVGPSPDWMRARLAACGVRAINNVVDVTNYVLLELGQPMHAFDAALLGGRAIVVRPARPGETLVTLDGKPRTLDPAVLVIADAERPAAIAGVMGGADAEVSDRTTQIVLESAWFHPRSVRATSKRLGLRTEASYRFERGADLTAPLAAMERALQLLEAIGAGTRRGSPVDCYPAPQQARELVISGTAISRLLGMDVPGGQTERILGSLGFGVRPLGGWHAGAPEAAVTMSQPGDTWQLTVPPWRVDVQRPVDVVEEVGRHHGFEHLPSTFPAIEQAPAATDARIARDSRVRRGLVAMGFSEAITFAFIETAAAAPYLDTAAPVTLANPLSEKFATLRPRLIPGLVDAVSHNRRHGRRDVRLFEIGTRFSPAGEARAAAAIWTGLATPDHWSGERREVDFFDLKGAAEQICRLLNVVPEFDGGGPSWFVAGRTAEVRVGGQLVGVVGQIVPALLEARDLPPGEAAYALEFDLDALAARAPVQVPLARTLPRHPSVVRDLALLVDDVLSAATVRDTIRAASPPILVDVREFDRYDGAGIAPGKVSLAMRLTFQAADRTLTDAEVHEAVDGITAALTAQLGARQR